MYSYFKITVFSLQNSTDFPSWKLETEVGVGIEKTTVEGRFRQVLIDFLCLEYGNQAVTQRVLNPISVK